jgi:hypothetical protein
VRMIDNLAILKKRLESGEGPSGRIRRPTRDNGAVRPASLIRNLPIIRRLVRFGRPLDLPLSIALPAFSLNQFISPCDQEA